MNIFQRLLAVAALTAIMALPLAVCAEEPVNYESDAKSAENTPPTIPHPIADDANGEICLACHRTGLNDAPPTPHPIRLNCTQCHVRSDLSDPKKTGKSNKTKGIE